MNLPEKTAEEDERKLKNLATRIMSNGVEVLVKDKNVDGIPEQTKYMEVKTIQPSASANLYMSNYPKIDKRIDGEEEDNFDLIHPSEISNVPCTSSCSCSSTKTEGLKTKYTSVDLSGSSKYGIKSTKFNANLRPTNKESADVKTQYGPYEYETNSPMAPTDKIVEKYTEVINDYSDEKDTSSVEESDLLTNEQAPTPVKNNKVNTKNPDKTKPDKPQKPNKNKFVVADLLKLGSLGIKGLSQLAPVIEKMTGGFIKRQDTVNKTSTTVKPAVKLTPYHVNKRIDSELEAKHSSFPIYIPVDEMETSESQLVFTNATLHQNIAWAAEHKQPKAHIVPPKIIHESPLVNGGIPISPGEIITANSDVIVGKPAVGGPLTLAASGIKLQNPVVPPPIDSFVSANEQYLVNETPLNDQAFDQGTKVDDSFDLRPPEPPKMKPKPSRPILRPAPTFNMQNIPNDQYPYRMPSSSHDHLMKTEQIKTTGTILGNHGRPAFLDYIPSLAKPAVVSNQHHINFKPVTEIGKDVEVADNSPSSSEVVHTKIRTEADYTITGNTESNKPFLVDIQPSRVANVLIPHGSSTALVFAGSSEPHKTGDYVDDPLPYPEPGYFGSFSIDAPQMTNVHNVAPNNNKQFMAKPTYNSPLDSYKPNPRPYKEQSIRNDLKLKWKDNKRPDYDKIPPPTSNQETHLQVGPQITVYDPNKYRPTNGDFDNLNQMKGQEKHKDVKEIIDKEYENYLAVPPPPRPTKVQYNQDVYDKSKPYSQKPIVHTKPVQDMKVFLNVQHPVPEQLPPKITSEIYFAAQMPNSNPTPTYTIHIPPVSPTYNIYNKGSNNIQPPKNFNNAIPVHNSFSVIASPNMVNKSMTSHENNDNTYTVTLNTATNVASNGESGQVVGSSIAVPVGSTSNVGQLNTDIPIGTNFAIRVEDNNPPLETFNVQENSKPNINYDEHGRVPQVSIAVGDNRWNKSSDDTSSTGNSYYNQNYGNKIVKDPVSSSIPPSLNSHANFPMINDFNIDINEAVKPATEYVDDVKSPDLKRPAKLIPNIPTNSHGWYSSVINENNINSLNVEATTRKIIPLIHNEKDSIPQFGQKIASVGKPPSELWPQKSSSLNLNIGKPFTKPQTTEKPYNTVPSFTKKPFNINYIPSNLGTLNQPAYDIPIRDNSYETTTVSVKIKSTTEKIKPVYENSEEIYDGEEEIESPGDIDGEVSSESMKVPVVSSSVEIENNSKSSTELTLLQDEVFKPPKAIQENEEQASAFNTGTQTEKPFGTYNRTSFTSNTIKPIYEQNSHMKPRPFTINTAMILDHQLQQPHWQINQMMENSTNMSYEDNLDLNIGEELKFESVPKTTTAPKPFTTQFDGKHSKPPRPVYNTRPDTTQVHNESIITSVVHIQDTKPLILEKPTEKAPLPSFTLSNIEINRTSSEIIDLSPPPPAINYNFKPTTNEMIMGMSPPPPRTPPGIRLPTRVPITPRPIVPIRSTTRPPYRTKPPRLSPPRMTTQRPVRKPITRDEVSTYRPAYDVLNSIRRPVYNRDQPSSQLLPPPIDIPSRVINPVNELPAPTINVPEMPNVVFPTPISSGWLTSSGFSFGPTPIQFPESPKPTQIPTSEEVNSSENSYSYEGESSPESSVEVSSEKSVTEDRDAMSKESSTETTTTKKATSTEVNDYSSESSNEEIIGDKMKVIPIVNKNRTRKPYPVRNDGKKSSTNRYKLPSKPTAIIRPTRTLHRPEILYPTRHTSTRKIIRPVTRPTAMDTPPNVIESSELPVDEQFIRPTEVLKQSSIFVPSASQIEISSFIENEPVTAAPSVEENPIDVKPTYIGGNDEVKISDDVTSTTTLMKTTTVTITRPNKTVYSTRYTNVTQINNDENKSSININKLPSEPKAIIKPTRQLYDSEVPYPTRRTSIYNIARPVTRPTAIVNRPNIIESSETPAEEEFMKPTEILKGSSIYAQPSSQIDIMSSLIEKESYYTTVASSAEENPIVEFKPTYLAGSENKILEEVTSTTTVSRTRTVTTTTTLTKPPTTIYSTGYINQTHTLTVFHTKTSLPTQSSATVTQTLVTVNTQPTPLDDISMSSEEDSLINKEDSTDGIIQKIDNEAEGDNDSFFVVMNKSQNGGLSPPVPTDIETGDYDGVTRNEQVNSNGVSQVLFGEILLAGAPFLETTNINPNGVLYGKECQPDCKASRNERCQRIDGVMKCVCRPGFARMFPDRPCKPTYTYSVKLALGTQGNERLEFHEHLSDNSSKEYQALAVATHEGINRMVMQSDLRDVFHGVHITGFHPVEMREPEGVLYQGVINEFYVQLSDNAHESRLKEVIEKYLRNNNYSLGGTEVHAASELIDKLDVNDFDECVSGHFHDCSEHAQCFNLRGTYTCSCLEGFADLSVNTLYPGRICSAEPVGCEQCNYHGACYSRDDRRVLCECFQWYGGSSCQINLKVVLISLVVCGALLSLVLAACAVLACSKRRPPRPQRSIVACIQSMPSLHQGAMPKQRADRRALISERGESGDASSLQNASLPYIPTKRTSSSGKKLVISDPPAHDPPPPPAPAVMIPRARLHGHHGDSRENIARKRSLELSSEAKLISYLESGATITNDEMRRKHSLESSYSANKDRHNKQGALVSAGFKVSTTIRPDETNMKEDRDDLSSVNKTDLEDLSRFDTLRKSYSQEELSEWTDAERRLGELTLSEARSVGGTLPASTGRAASSTRLTHQEANTMAERDLGSTFLLPHVHLYKPDLTSDVSEFDSL